MDIARSKRKLGLLGGEERKGGGGRCQMPPRFGRGERWVNIKTKGQLREEKRDRWGSAVILKGNSTSKNRKKEVGVENQRLIPTPHKKWA